MGKNSMSLDLSGFTGMLERIQKAGGEIDRAAEKALSESAKPFYDDLKDGIKKHHETGLTEASLRSPNDVTWDGNRITLKVGFDLSKGGLPALFIEYGTPKQAPDPFIQPAITKNKSKAKKIQQRILGEILGELDK